MHLEFIFENNKIYTIKYDYGSELFPFDQSKVEQFHHRSDENMAKDEIVCQMAVQIAWCLLLELQDAKLEKTDSLRSSESEFSYRVTFV